MSAPVLEVAGLCKAFGALKASDAVDLDLRAGEIHALIGPNGAGKSTLVRLITGEIAPDAGRISLCGRPIDALDAAGRARLGLGRSFQVSQVVGDFTARENVMLAIQGATRTSWRFIRAAARDASLRAPAEVHLAQVGLAERADQRADALAHGERRRLELAMALALRPVALLLDEPMAGSGPEGARVLTGLLAQLRREVPILLIEHDMDAVFALADRISVLVYGRIIATGTVAEIRANPEVRRSYLGEGT
ncbi:MAG: ABC transporter ATP-binding protein [Gemmobacter sp.]